MKNIYLLDFDGVICDSVDECMIVSYNAYYCMNFCNIHEIDVEMQRYFKKYRSFVGPAGEYFLIWKAYDFKADLDGQLFKALKKEYSSQLNEFAALFFNQRTILKKDMSHWISLHKIYSHIMVFLDNLKENLFIITTKDRDSVERIAAYFGFIDKIEDIYSMEISTNKKVLIEKLLFDYSIETHLNRVVFIDDNIEHIRDVKSMNNNIVSYLAQWGYVSDKNPDGIRVIMDINEATEAF